MQKTTICKEPIAKCHVLNSRKLLNLCFLISILSHLNHSWICFSMKSIQTRQDISVIENTLLSIYSISENNHLQHTMSSMSQTKCLALVKTNILCGRIEIWALTHVLRRWWLSKWKRNLIIMDVTISRHFNLIK
jgi:hypothetical protein